MRNFTGQAIWEQLIEFIAWQTINTGAGKFTSKKNILS